MKYFISPIIFFCFICFGCIVLVSCEKEYDEITEITGNYNNTSGKGDSDQTGGSTEDSEQDDDSTGGNTYRECPRCGGSGECTASNCNYGICILCDGLGYTMSGKYKFPCSCDHGRCGACHGSYKCSRCNGRGYIY